MRLLMLLLSLIVSWGWFYIALSSGIGTAIAAIVWVIAAVIVAVIAHSTAAKNQL